MQHAIFAVLDHKQTGLNFNNELTATPAFNVFKYMYFYNGAGIGAGDFNNDGFIDLFFASNQHQNKLFLNLGSGKGGEVSIKYKDVTADAQIPDDRGWSTGVSVVDINNDGLLDIYVCRVGKYETLAGKNQLLICQGIDKNGVPIFEDEAANFGIDFSGFSTQAAFMDYDLDGDLDMFLMNHTVHQNGTFAPRAKFLGTYHPLSGDRLYRNNGNNKFSDVTVASMINSSAISYGLGVAVSDIDLDGWPDMYIGNDFHENDYLYINQKNGTYKDESAERLMHTSQYSMGVDVADINNDAFPEIISLDMLPADPYILKRSIAEDEYNTHKMKLGYGYSHQYSRNNLQLHRGNGMFSEVGLYAGIHATDWSWAPLWMDFDNDGLKDLFISNVIPKKLNDIDYVNYVSDEKIQEKILSNTMGEKEMRLIEKFPEIKLPNKFYKNMGNAKFQDEEASIEGDIPTYSNGAVYADLDNDGDLDIVVNNINDPVIVYENKSNDLNDKNFLKINLKGSDQNVRATGAKIIVHGGESVMLYEKYPVKGFLSSMETPLLVGLNKVAVDSMFLVWPDNTYQALNWKDSVQTINYKKGLPTFTYSSLTYRKESSKPMENITQAVNLLFRHEENPFIEFDRESLIPFMVSREGPALAVGDANGDFLDDVFIGSSKRKKPVLFLQNAAGTFTRSVQPALDNDSTYEDVDAAWVDVNNDGANDLIVASGGNEYYGADTMLLPRVYINNGRGTFYKLSHAFTDVLATASCLAPYDFTGDGFVDLFIGGRSVPYEYGQLPMSYLLVNDGSGRFQNVNAKISKEISNLGFVKSAIWFDIDKDGARDLLIASEWGGLVAFTNNKGRFTKKILSSNFGWWNFILPVDVDGAGNTAFVAGNLGLNSRVQASAEQPVNLYYGDFDDNGKKEQVFTYFIHKQQVPFANRDELQKQIPVIKKKFLYAEDFAKASLDNIFTPAKLAKAEKLTVNYFANSIIVDTGRMQFETKPLPWRAQLSPYKTGVSFDANGDKLSDLLLFGNFYENNIQMGRNDADFGMILINKGAGNFTAENINGLQIKGEVRHVRKITIKGREAFILVRNNDSATVIRVRDARN